MKILIFTTQIYQLGGAEKLAVELVHGLNSVNVETHLAVLYGSIEGKDLVYLNDLKAENYLIKEHYLLNTRVNPGIIDILKLVSKLKKIIKTNEFDYIETSMITPSIIATFATLFGKCKHVVGFHQSFQMEMYKDAKYKLFSILTWIARKNKYYGISDFVINSWRNAKGFRIPQNKSYKLYNNIGERLNNEKEVLYIKPDVMNVIGKKILCVGRLTVLKGYHLLFESIKNDLNQFDWHIFFVGERHLATADDEKIFQNIQSEIVQLRLKDRVHFIPFTKNVASYMKYCDVLVHPTQYEGFGLVLVEAMRLRVPIITTNVEAIPEIVNGTGIIQLNYSDTKGLRSAICKCLNEFSKEDEAVIEKAFVRSLQFTLNNRVNFFLEMIKQ